MDNLQVVDVKLIKAIMEARGITQKKMAEGARVSVSTINRFLKGGNQYSMPIDRLYAIAKVLDVPIDLLIHKNYR